MPQGSDDIIVQTVWRYIAAQREMQTAKNELNQYLPVGVNKQAFIQKTANAYPLNAKDQKTLRVSANLQRKLLYSSEVVPGTLQNEYLVPESVGYSRLIQQAKLDIQAEAVNAALDKSFADILALIYQDRLTDFFTNYFSLVDTRPETHARTYTLQMLRSLQLAIEYDPNQPNRTYKNQPLQEFYGQDAEKNWRGVLKLESNPLFKDTDSLISFINKYFYLNF